MGMAVMHLSWPTMGAFLKEHRRLISRDAVSLGSYPRLPARHGKGVTQEEIAEAIGVSRVWYAMLESGAALHTSPRLLGRLADALALPDASREALFRLGVPELANRNPGAALQELSSSIFPLRSVARRVWSATSETEILAIVVEAASQTFPDADFAGAFKRMQPGAWEYPVLFGGQRVKTTLADLHAELFAGLSAAQIDEAMLYEALTEPGQVGTRAELHRNLSVKSRIDKAFDSVGFDGANFLDAHVKSREGVESTIFVNYVDGYRTFSELDRLVLGSLADLASLAISEKA
jgi:transcriptional regulator with XRE-family HTH domain